VDGNAGDPASPDDEEPDDHDRAEQAADRSGPVALGSKQRDDYRGGDRDDEAA
jgi:hypothetical protein